MLAVDISLLQEQAASVLADVAQGSQNQDIQDALEQTDLTRSCVESCKLGDTRRGGPPGASPPGGALISNPDQV